MDAQEIQLYFKQYIRHCSEETGSMTVGQTLLQTLVWQGLPSGMQVFICIESGIETYELDSDMLLNGR